MFIHDAMSELVVCVFTVCRLNNYVFIHDAMSELVVCVFTVCRLNMCLSMML